MGRTSHCRRTLASVSAARSCRARCARTICRAGVPASSTQAQTRSSSSRLGVGASSIPAPALWPPESVQRPAPPLPCGLELVVSSATYFLHTSTYQGLAGAFQAIYSPGLRGTTPPHLSVARLRSAWICIEDGQVRWICCTWESDTTHRHRLESKYKLRHQAELSCLP